MNARLNLDLKEIGVKNSGRDFEAIQAGKIRQSKRHKLHDFE
jgi:hypothetical protein